MLYNYLGIKFSIFSKSIRKMMSDDLGIEEDILMAKLEDEELCFVCFDKIKREIKVSVDERNWKTIKL